ncbi:cytochrome D oxidase subunit II [Chimaeribacter arupi]|uniref:cytochrome d ubiquinol oxidase subunit II n=1 Tax=Chimaeribacter arupi TaxID=2060066 RepID=UPI000C7CA1DB|nr:cytochrome d ubiquinol oxidase subunit II [Chimaeribacter arupi]PLR46994.1 cytochrome D oxidase subunit II [Chimaeribacter arupi]
MEFLTGHDGLAIISTVTLAFSLLTYLLLDGTDLGVGIWLGVTPQAADRHRLALSILPIWDANETWLVLLLGGMLALFPAAYSAFFTAMLVPSLVMAMALVLRGAAVEFRQVSRRPWLCDAAIFAGSLIAAFFQGILFGSVIQGIPGGAAPPETLLWCTPFTLFSGGLLVAVYLLMGAGWLIWRMAGELSRQYRQRSAWLGGLTLLLCAIFLTWMTHLNAHNAARWHDTPVWVTFVLLLAVLTGIFYRVLPHHLTLLPLMTLLLAVTLVFLAIALTLFPYVLPPDLTLFNSAAPPATQGFVLVGYVLVIPFTLFYNTYVFSVFRGKIHRQSATVKN